MASINPKFGSHPQVLAVLRLRTHLREEFQQPDWRGVEQSLHWFGGNNQQEAAWKQEKSGQFRYYLVGKCIKKNTVINVLLKSMSELVFYSYHIAWQTFQTFSVLSNNENTLAGTVDTAGAPLIVSIVRWTIKWFCLLKPIFKGENHVRYHKYHYLL
jgi:hypothetical protein